MNVKKWDFGFSLYLTPLESPHPAGLLSNKVNLRPNIITKKGKTPSPIPSPYLNFIPRSGGEGPGSHQCTPGFFVWNRQDI